MNNNSLNILVDDPQWKTVLPEVESVSLRVFETVLAYVDAHENIDFLKDGHNIIVNLSLSNDNNVHHLNLEFRNMDKPTNVLSFAAIDDPAFKETLAESENLELGDIIIALETMQKEAFEQNISFYNHFCHLLAHGLLHLLGFDHQTDEEADYMEGFEIAILQNLNIDNPYKEL